MPLHLPDFLDSFQGMFLPAFGGVPFVDRSRASTDYNLESDDEENQVDKKKRVRLLCDEILTSAKKNSFPSWQSTGEVSSVSVSKRDLWRSTRLYLIAFLGIHQKHRLHPQRQKKGLRERKLPPSRAKLKRYLQQTTVKTSTARGFKRRTCREEEKRRFLRR
ncbi:hypothetical protein OS493_014213 [Desmophyllum pertusum]|uniref:Uncharacterized protein n=1 Tax=Desmophyllum pertusum TaxID=174260 RepID=A0A9W9Z0T9_9CNID|nr:hypothetical protein OS493_014213 [Desmophyllum pertusum]